MIGLFFDTETTGFTKPGFEPEIVQFAAILQDTACERPISEVSLIVEPHGIIPAEATAIHGITTELAKNYGIGNVAADTLFCDLLAAADVLVAHNIEFDLEMVKLNWPGAGDMLSARSRLRSKIALFDTMHELTPIMKMPKTGENHYHDDKYPEWKAPKLQEAYQHFYGKPFEGAHDAMTDTRALRDVYFAMHRSNTSAGK